LKDEGIALGGSSKSLQLLELSHDSHVTSMNESHDSEEDGENWGWGVGGGDDYQCETARQVCEEKVQDNSKSESTHKMSNLSIYPVLHRLTPQVVHIQAAY